MTIRIRNKKDLGKKKKLSDADLSYADLRNADLRWADLRDANLWDADLTEANLSGAVLCDADLSGANLRGADLSDAYLRDAYLRDAYFENTNRGAYIINNVPLQLTGLVYDVIIWDEHMEIGCESHSFTKWRKFTDSRIKKMEGVKALKFWKENKTMLMSMCKTRG